MASRWRYAFYKLLPPFLTTTGEGERLAYTIGRTRDAFVERIRQTVLMRFPTKAVDRAALSYIGADRMLTRGLYETDESYTRRLLAFRGPDAHKTRGNGETFVRQLAIFLGAPRPGDSVEIVVTPAYAPTIHYVYNGAGEIILYYMPQLNPPTSNWGAFRVDINNYLDVGDNLVQYDQTPTVYYDQYPAARYDYGFNDPSFFSGLADVINFWKPAGTTPSNGVYFEGVRVEL